MYNKILAQCTFKAFAGDKSIKAFHFMKIDFDVARSLSDH